MENFYSSNDDFKDYVDKFCKQYGLTKEEAVEIVLNNNRQVSDLLERALEV